MTNSNISCSAGSRPFRILIVVALLAHAIQAMPIETPNSDSDIETVDIAYAVDSVPSGSTAITLAGEPVGNPVVGKVTPAGGSTILDGKTGQNVQQSPDPIVPQSPAPIVQQSPPTKPTGQPGSSNPSPYASVDPKDPTTVDPTTVDPTTVDPATVDPNRDLPKPMELTVDGGMPQNNDNSTSPEDCDKDKGLESLPPPEDSMPKSKGDCDHCKVKPSSNPPTDSNSPTEPDSNSPSGGEPGSNSPSGGEPGSNSPNTAPGSGVPAPVTPSPNSEVPQPAPGTSPQETCSDPSDVPLPTKPAANSPTEPGSDPNPPLNPVSSNTDDSNNPVSSNTDDSNNDKGDCDEPGNELPVSPAGSPQANSPTAPAKPGNELPVSPAGSPPAANSPTASGSDPTQPVNPVSPNTDDPNNNNEDCGENKPDNELPLSPAGNRPNSPTAPGTDPTQPVDPVSPNTDDSDSDKNCGENKPDNEVRPAGSTPQGTCSVDTPQFCTPPPVGNEPVKPDTPSCADNPEDAPNPANTDPTNPEDATKPTTNPANADPTANATDPVTNPTTNPATVPPLTLAKPPPGGEGGCDKPDNGLPVAPENGLPVAPDNGLSPANDGTNDSTCTLDKKCAGADPSCRFDTMTGKIENCRVEQPGVGVMDCDKRVLTGPAVFRAAPANGTTVQSCSTPGSSPSGSPPVVTTGSPPVVDTANGQCSVDVPCADPTHCCTEFGFCRSEPGLCANALVPAREPLSSKPAVNPQEAPAVQPQDVPAEPDCKCGKNHTKNM